MTFLESSLDRQALAHPNPGRAPAPHRLNRAEYANAIRDILGVDLDVTSLLPPDDSGYGFDNISDVLSVSPMLAERYLAAAQRISRIAVGDPTLRPTTEAFSVNKYLRQDDRVSEDLPFGSRGGLAIRYYFPVDADYVVKVFLDRTYDGRVRGLGDAHVLEVRLNGEKVQTVDDRRSGRERRCRRWRRGAAARVARARRRRDGSQDFREGRTGNPRRDVSEEGGRARRDVAAGVRGDQLRVRRRRGPAAGDRQRRTARPLRHQRVRRFSEPPAHFCLPPA